MPVFATEGRHAGEYIVWEPNANYCREKGRLAAGNNLEPGAVLGKITDAATATADAGNTGDGVISAVTIGPDAINGTYTLTCTAVASNAGTFSVTDPNGGSLPNLTVAVAYVGSHINLTVADGADDWVLGDEITIDVILGEYAALAPLASNGSQTAATVLFDRVDATSVEKDCVVTARMTTVNLGELVWPSGITEVQKRTAINQLKTAGIVPR
jgi:hypothetical protein